MDTERLTTPAAAELLGIKDDQFRRLVKRLRLEPVDYYTNPHYRSGPMCPLYSPEAIQALVDGPEVASIHDRSTKLKEGMRTKPMKRAKLLERRYPDWRDAIPAAAEAMFNLNRYAKSRRCTDDNRREIYDRKNSFLRVVCGFGYATEAKLHTVERPGKECYRCDGFEGDDSCDRCGGSGWYLPPDTLEFVAFRFLFGDKTYSWHQPRELVDWPWTPTASEEPWEPETTEKPVFLARNKFADAKALVQFVVESAQASRLTTVSSTS